MRQTQPFKPFLAISRPLLPLLPYLALLWAICGLSVGLQAQSFAPSPWFKACFYDSNGNPLSGGLVYTYAAQTTNPQATWTDYTGNTLNTNPVVLDGSGCAQIWVNNSAYKYVLTDANNVQQYVVDNVTDPGLSALASSVLLNPAGAVNQTIVGPLSANYFTGVSGHTTSPGVRVAILAPTTALDTASNPPNLVTTQPAVAGQAYTIPDPGTPTGAVIISPGQTTNVLDCTATGITCKRFAYTYFEGAGCNNTTAGLAWDNFGTNAPDPLCVTGSNIQKGVMGLRSAATKYQNQTANGNCNLTCTLTYPLALGSGDMGVVVVAVDGSKTVTSLNDGTNAYAKVASKTNGTTDCELWTIPNAAAKAAATTLTLTLSAQANAAWEFMAYKDLTTTPNDVNANNSATGTAVTTGTTVGTAQNTELILSVVCSPSNPSVTFGSGTTGHSVVSQSTNITVASSGRIQQASGTQSDSFTLGSSQAWAALIATFKANVAGSEIAQRQFRLPSFYDSTATVSSNLMWLNPLLPTGTVNVKLGAQTVCTASGTTDDPTFNAATEATAVVNASSANILTDTAITPLTMTGCAANNNLHFQVLRDRYNAADTYEGYVYLSGASLKFGVTQ